MKFTVAGRTVGKKSALKKIRRDGNIPAILYAREGKNEELLIDGAEFKKFLNSIEPGMLSSVVFTLEIGGKVKKAIIKDIQYAVTTYAVIHLDFLELQEDVKVKLNIPIKCANIVDCQGVKLGGNLRQLVRQLQVICLPKDIPSHFEFDVQNLGLGEGMKLRDLAIPSGVKPLMDLNQMAVVVARR